MIAVLCFILFLTSAPFAKGGVDIVDRKRYLGFYVPISVPCIPPNDAEVWYGWRRIYMAETVFLDTAGLKFSVKFEAPPGRLSTAIEIDDFGDVCGSYEWVRINIPGADVDRGVDLLPHRPAESGRAFRAVVIFPQKKRLDVTSANQFFTGLKGCNVSELESALQLSPPNAIHVYDTFVSECGGGEYRVSNGDTPDWDAVRPNLDKISDQRLFSAPPRGVLEVEYYEGVSLRMGNCLPKFLTASAPTTVKFAAVAGMNYTLCYVNYKGPPNCKWLVVNIPDGDFRKGFEMVPYVSYTNNSEDYAPFVFLLFSQGNVVVPRYDNQPYVTPRIIATGWKLGDPVAANFYRTYWGFGVLPRGRAPWQHPSMSSSPGTSSTRSASTSVIPETTESDASVLLKCGVCVTLIGLAIVFHGTRLNVAALQ